LVASFPKFFFHSPLFDPSLFHLSLFCPFDSHGIADFKQTDGG
jgi:hypothetical protein